MAKRGIRYISIFLLFHLLAPLGTAGGPLLTVRVCNFSSAGNPVLSQAEAVARRIFQDAGIDTEWIDAGDPGKLDPSTLTVQIFDGRSRRLDAKGAFGVAILVKETTPFLADVFFGAIEESATTRKDQSLLLGHVLAHEVGHLLLGAGHTPETIMAENLASHDLSLMKAGRLRFSRRQAERLRVAAGVREAARGKD